jgi:broad specificity phosphatase PhoE
MKTIYFVRHGQSQANAGGVTMEHHAIPLTDIGRRQAQALALMLPQSPAGVWVSPFVRARDTARPYCERLSRQAVVLDEAREFETIDPALLEGMTGAQRRPIADAYWAESDVSKRMGARAETFLEFAARVARFAAVELPKLPDGAVLFGHGMWMGMLLWRWLGFGAADHLDMRSFRRFQLGLPMPNGAVYRLLEIAHGHWTVAAETAIMRRMAGLAEPEGGASQAPAGAGLTAGA